jgi:hypothetical protein
LTSTIPKVRFQLCRRANVNDFIDALTAKVGTLSLEAQSKLEKDTAKKEAKAEAKADAALKKKMASQVCEFGDHGETIFSHLTLSNR